MSTEMWNEYRRNCSKGDTVSYLPGSPLFTEAKGHSLFDASGRRYLDMQMGYGSVSLGYQHPTVMTAALNMLRSVPTLASQWLTKQRVELSRRINGLCEAAFDAQGRVHFSVGGAGAVEDALKLVHSWWLHSPEEQRHTILALEGGYHGRTEATTALASNPRYRRLLPESIQRAIYLPAPLPEDDEGYKAGLMQIEETRDIAAFIFEPLQGTGRGYARMDSDRLVDYCSAITHEGGLIISDEMRTGFFRTGQLWGCQLHNITPDIVVFGKALTNGLYPLAGFWAREELFEKFEMGSAHATFAGAPVGCAAGLAVLDVMDSIAPTAMLQEDLLIDQVLRKMALDYSEHLVSAYSTGHAGHIRFRDKQTLAWLVEEGLRSRKTECGLILDTAGPDKTSLMLSPAFGITEKMLLEFADTVGYHLDHLER